MTGTGHALAQMPPAERSGYDPSAISPREIRRDRMLSIIGAIAVHAILVVFVAFLAVEPSPTTEEPVAIEMVMLPDNPPSPEKASAPEEPVEMKRPVEAEPPAPAAVSPPAPLPARSAEILPAPPAPRPAVPKPKPSREAPPTPPVQAAEPESRPTATPAGPALAAPEPATPPASVAPAAASASADYAARLVAWLERYKIYPRAARLRRIEGHIVLRLALAPDGKVKTATLENASGQPLLDRAALDMVQRADPMPPLPAALSAGGEFLVPVAFALGP